MQAEWLLRRRSRRPASLPLPAGQARPTQGFVSRAPPAMDVLSDDVLGLVLQRVDSHVSLIRAAAVCKRWRRAIADAGFLRRFRALHARPITGYYDNLHAGGPAFVPLSPTLVDARHFSLDFLPDDARSGMIVDSRGSLLLLSALGDGEVLDDKFVCEPVTRRYMRIHPPSDFDDRCFNEGSYLIDGKANEAGSRISMSNFRVLCLVSRDGLTQAAMYAAGSSWSKANIRHIGSNLKPLFLKGPGDGVWSFIQGRTLITLDRSNGDFFSSELPPLKDLNSDSWNFNFGRDGKLRIFTASNGAIKVFLRCEGGDCALEKTIMLSEITRGLTGYDPSFFSDLQVISMTGVGFVVISPWTGGPWLFSVGLDTMEVAPVAEVNAAMAYVCELPWPPALHACLDG